MHTKNNRLLRARCVVAFACLSALGLAQAQSAVTLSPEETEVLSTEGMQLAHPDFRWRWAGLRELDAGAPLLAHTYLTRAARYADKPAQAMLAEMYWSGVGAERNPALAYAWMDLAAERGYVVFVAHREKYWAALSADQQQAALELGRGLYAEYGDAVAQPRLEKVLRRGQRKATGSRAGASMAVRVYRAPSVPPLGGVGLFNMRGQLAVGTLLPDYYADRLWRPADYWEWQDLQYTHLPLQLQRGEVEVGEPQPKRDEDASREAKGRARGRSA